MTLSRRTLSAARWTSFSTVARIGLQLAQIAVLARFLLPQDYGLMAMVTVVLSYADLFSDMGLSTAFVQRQKISHEERSSLYWLNVLVGGGLTLVIFVVSPLAAYFFKEPQLVPLMMLAATNFLAIALGQQLRVDAEKTLNFRPVAIIEVTAAIGGFSVAVVAAWLDFGVYALVLASMTCAWLTMLLSWMLLANGWRPCWRLRWGEVRWFVRFGGGMVLNNVFNHVNATIDVLLGGRLLGATQLGLYSIPRNLILQVQFMVNPIFTRVGFPLIAAIQDDKERVKQVYLKTMNMTASVNAPIYVAIGAFSPEIVLLLLGEKWLEAAPLLRVLAIWGLLRSFGNPAGSLLFGMGRVKLAALWNAGLLLIIPPVLWLGSWSGIFGMAWTLVVLMAVLFLPAWAILIKPVCGVGLREYAAQIVLPTICAMLAGVFAWFVASQFALAYVRLVIGLSIGLATYVGFSWKLNKTWCSEVKRVVVNSF